MTAALRPEAERLVEDQWRQKKNDPAAVAEAAPGRPGAERTRPTQRRPIRLDARWPDLVRWQFVGAVVGEFLGTVFGFGKISGFDLRSMAPAVGGELVVLLIYGPTR